jgi:hypothetical protein
MSYCRWSSDDYSSDVYAFEHVNDGFVIHVASSRYVFKEPLPPAVPLSDQCFYDWMRRHQKVTEMCRTADNVTIGLPHDGETFITDTAGECADQLERLSVIGYNVPQYAIDALRAEAAEVGL